MLRKFVRGYYKVFIVIILVIAFFWAYNTYLIDHSLENLAFALNEMSVQALPQNVRELGVILDYAVINELATKRLNSERLAKLEITQTILNKGEAAGQLKDAQMFFKDVVAEKQKTRGRIFITLDRISKEVNNVIGYVFHPKYEEPKMLGASINIALIEAAKSLENKEEFLKAAQAYSELIKKYPDYKKINIIRLRQAYCYQRVAFYEEAKKIYQNLIKSSPDSFEGRLAKQLLIKLQEIMKIDLEKVTLEKKIASLASKSDLQEAYYQLGNIYMRQLDFNNASQTFKKAIDIDPKSPLAIKIEFHLARNYKFAGKLNESIKVNNQIIKEYSTVDLAKDAHFQIADTLSRQDKYAEAIEEFSQVAAEFKTETIGSVAQFQVGSTYLYGLKDIQKAKEAFDKLIEVYPATKVSEYTKEKIADVAREYYREGFKNLLEKNYDSAKEEFNKALEIDPDSAIAFAGRGTLYAKLGEKKLALSDGQRAIELKPQDSYTRSALGYIYVAFGEYDNAIIEYKRSLELEPKNPEARYNLACAYEFKADLQQALQEYKNVLSIKPDYADAHGNLGRVYWSLGEYADAIKHYQMAIEIFPGYIEAHYNLGLVYKYQKRYLEAGKEFNQVLELNPDFKDTKSQLKDLKK